MYTLSITLLLLISLSSFASAPLNPVKDFSAKKIVTLYLAAIANGQGEFNKHILADDFEYRNSVNNTSFNKKEYAKFLKANDNISYNCKTHYTVLDETSNTCIAKTTMKFEKFTRVDYITLQRSKDGWKVSKVVTTYP